MVSKDVITPELGRTQILIRPENGIFGEARKTANKILCVHLSIQNPVLGPVHSVVNKMSIVPPSFHSSLQGTHHVQGAVLA